jgi:hypothetical protein
VLTAIGIAGSLANSALGQAKIFFNNRATVGAAVYGINDDAPTVRLSGNATTNGGSQNYTGVPLVFGTNFTAQLWYGQAGTTRMDDLQAVTSVEGTRTFRSAGSFNGFIQQSPDPAILDGIPYDTTAAIQMRVWDNRGGAITSWEQAMVAAVDGTLATGYSDIFTSLPLVAPPNPPPGMSGLASFNLTFIGPLSYALRISSTGYGIVTFTPLKPRYLPGEVVEISATPSRWNVFGQWSDGVSANSRSIVMESNVSLTTSFIPTTPLEVVSSGNISRLAPIGMPAIFVDGEFVVTESTTRYRPAHISMQTTYPNGTIFYTTNGSAPSLASTLYTGPFQLRRSRTIRAIAYDANFLNPWEADPVEVIFRNAFTFNVTTPGGGTVSVAPSLSLYPLGAVVTVTATPQPGWTFLQWLGDASGDQPVQSVTIDGNKCLQAIFATSLNTTSVGSGSVEMHPAGGLYGYGTVVELTPRPDPGNYLVLWGNAGSGTASPLRFTVTTPDRVVSSAFTSLPVGEHTLTPIADGGGQLIVSPQANRYANGQLITLMATAAAEQDFLGWSGDASGKGNPLTLTMDESKTITAHFTKRPHLSVAPCFGGLTEQGFQMVLTGEAGGAFQIDTTTQPKDWTPLAVLTNIFGFVSFLDTSVTNEAKRFYRAQSLP